MAPASAIPQNFPFSLPNHNRSRSFFQNGPNSAKKPTRIHPKIRTVAFNGVQIKHTQRNFLEPSLPIRVLVPHSMFLQVGPRKTHSAPRIQAKSMGSDSSSASTSLQSVSGILHLIVSLGIILTMDKVLKKAFMAAAIKFPSALFGMFCVFTILMVLDSTVPAAATSLMNFFEPALLFIQRWLPLFYVPSLVVLPLAVKDIPAASGIKICFILVAGWLASLSVAGYTAIAVRKMVKTEMIPAEPMSKPSPFSPLEVWIWSGTFIVSFVAALFYPTVLGTNARTCLPFLLASTVLGYMVGSRLPAGVKKVFHPIICCALSADLAAFAFGYLSRSGIDPVLGTQVPGHYLTKASSNPGAGDILMGFLGSVIISFSFSMFKQRKVTYYPAHLTSNLLRGMPLKFSQSVIIATLFSLYSTCSHWTPGRVRTIFNHFNSTPMYNCGASPQHCVFFRRYNTETKFILICLCANSSLTAAAVVLTGLVGANFVQAMLDKLHFDDPIARGIATASSAHGLGTAALSAKEPVALPFCAIAYALTGIFGSLFCSVPAVRQSLLAIVG
ncbi:hypothetical protein HYC85_027072 [Camellia sinensis]|uniref:Plastidal glycolate/glycerate translocator 1, chloroplastic n=1 Tax=Camellia sinensis TaxID=4442 RepID=A0A7J7G5D2_CAMSI|nr:hypothetical protein HYC85_027072 [Camellia sinensis]